MFSLGESYGQRSLVGYGPWGLRRVRHDLATQQLLVLTAAALNPENDWNSTLSCRLKPLWPESRAPRWGWERGGRTRMPFRSTFFRCCPSSDAHLSWPPLTDPLFFFWTPRVDVLTSLTADVHLRDPAGPQQAPAHGRNRRCMLAARSLPKDGAAVSGYFILLYSRCYWPFCGLWILNVLNIVIASWSLYGGRVATCFQFSDVETWGLVYVSDVPLLLECRRWHVCDALGAVPDVCQYEHVCVSRLCLPLKPTLPPNLPSPLATRLMHIPDL